MRSQHRLLGNPELPDVVNVVKGKAELMGWRLEDEVEDALMANGDLLKYHLQSAFIESEYIKLRKLAKTRSK